YAFSAVFFGYAIDRFSFLVIIPCFVIFSLLTGLMVLMAPKAKAAQTKDVGKRGNLGRTVARLLANRQYMFPLVSYLLVEMSAQPGQNYLTRKFEVLQAGEIFTGLALLVMGLLQLPTLNNMDRLSSRFSPDSLMWIALFGILLRSIILGFSRTAVGTLCCFLTEPFAFGLYIGAILLYMRRYLPEDIRYFGMTLYSAMTGGVGGMLGNYLSGALAEHYGILRMLEFMMIPAFLGVLVFSASVFLLRETKATS
ncbi:MAG: MFS transporter, partial [Spirochaetales bacterium]|nr:MFS transporter [Candidatus Physcosoma equi]